MSGKRNLISIKTAFGTSLVVVIGLVGWRAMQPGFNTATMDEIRAVLPPELLKQDPIDKFAQQQYKDLVAMIPKLDPRDINKVYLPSVPIASRYRNALQFWDRNPQLATKISNLLDKGPIQCPQEIKGDVDTWKVANSIFWFSMLTVTSASLFAANGDYDRSTRLLVLTSTLGHRLMESEGDRMTYTSASQMCIYSDRTIGEVASLRALPIPDCIRLLRALPPAGMVDEAYATSVRVEFQRSNLRWLPDPRRYWMASSEALPASTVPMRFSQPGLGTYDAIQTAKVFASALPIEIANSLKPWSEFDHSAELILKKETEGLPEPAYIFQRDKVARLWADWRYQFSMDTTKNSIGRRLLQVQENSESDLVKKSCEWRATHNATRVLLASRLYRADHGGDLPSTTTGFSSLLGAWPRDPYNGKPMIYDAKKEVAYCVGENLVDDGGDITTHPSGSLDVGVSLKVH